MMILDIGENLILTRCFCQDLVFQVIHHLQDLRNLILLSSNLMMIVVMTVKMRMSLISLVKPRWPLLCYYAEKGQLLAQVD